MLHKIFSLVACLACVTTPRAQQHVRGTVYDGDTGDGLPGAIVQVRNTDICSTTDSTGRYKITVPGPSYTLVYTAGGCLEFMVRVGRKNGVNVVLNKREAYVTDVNVGYGTQAANQVTGAVSSIGRQATAGSYMISYTTIKREKKKKETRP